MKFPPLQLPNATVWLVVLLASFGPRAAGVAPEAAPESARVIILANAADADSCLLADYYARARSIPAVNIVALPLPAAETITWPEFTTRIFNPLSAWLRAHGWIDALPSQLLDPFGRVRTMASGHRIAYLVTMRGVPLHLAANPAWPAPAAVAGAPAGAATNEAAVDSELALLAGLGTGQVLPVAGWVRNPLYHDKHPSGPEAAAVVRVTRLDGPDPAAVRAMIDGALAAERDGLIGRAYVDLGGIHPLGDAWLAAIERRLDAAGYDLAVERTKDTFGVLARFDAPAWYFGWYVDNVNGPFTAPGFRFPPGAIAVHIHSFSAQTVRSASAHWSGPLIARGATATLGNVAEPYLQASHNLELFAEALLDGKTFGEAAWYALPTLSWQCVALGDPLYRPMARTFADQWADRARLPAQRRTYVAVRQARLTLRAGHKEEAVRMLRSEFLAAPTLAGGLALAQVVRDVEGREAAVRELAFLGLLDRFEPADAGTVCAAAALLTECGATDRALELYAKLLAHPPAGPAEALLLEEAIRQANAAGQPARADPWQARLLQLRPAGS